MIAGANNINWRATAHEDLLFDLPNRIFAMAETAMTDTVHDRRLQVWESFLRAHACLIETLNGELEKERGIPLVWYAALQHLAKAEEGRMRMQELAGATLLSFSGLTRLFDRMSEVGLVKREPCAQDRRGTFACITPEGRKVLESATPVHVRGVQEHFARHLSDEEVAALQTALTKLMDSARSGQPHCCDE